MHHSVTMTGDSVESHVSSSVLLVETPVERFSETESSVNDKRTRVIAERTKHDAADSVKVKHKKNPVIHRLADSVQNSVTEEFGAQIDA